MGEVEQGCGYLREVGDKSCRLLAMPKRERTSDTFLGGSICFRAWTLLGDGLIPSFEKVKPNLRYTELAFFRVEGEAAFGVDSQGPCHGPRGPSQK